MIFVSFNFEMVFGRGSLFTELIYYGLLYSVFVHSLFWTYLSLAYLLKKVQSVLYLLVSIVIPVVHNYIEQE